MAVTIKSKKEIELMREAGKMLEEVHNKLADFVKPGISTLEIDQFGEKAIRDLGCVPNFLNYNGYPASICVSVNDEVVHGIPSKDRILQDGDIVSLDAGLIHEGYHSDAARTHAVGNISEEAKRLIEVTKQSFFEGIKLAVPGNHLFDISEAIQKYVESNGYSVVRPGMTLAIEPMVNEGSYDVVWLDDDWTVVTEDGSLAAHYENTIVITEDGCEILTLSE